MYDNFELSFDGQNLMGYVWDVPTPQKVMCIIHGIGEHCGRYDRMAGYLTESGIAVIGIDLIGHGQSPGKRGHTFPRDKVLESVSLMIEKAKELYPDIPLILYGHSMGGNICLDYRSRGRLNDVPAKYIVSAPWLKLVKKIPKALYNTVKQVAKVSSNLQMSSGCEAENLGNIELTASYSVDPMVHIKITIGTAVECMEFADALLKGKNENNGRAIGTPLLLMHGVDDLICDIKGSRILAARLHDNPNFKYIEWEGHYHEIHNGGPNYMGEEVINTIVEYVLE